MQPPESSSAATELDGHLCGHWTFFGPSNKERTARCDLPAGHSGMHKFWTNPDAGESFSWSDVFERHHREGIAR